jgi:CBS domain containing-hemolysin-like protein
VHEPTATLDVFGVAWRLAATLFFVALNGFFVAAEFALVKARTARIDQLAAAGSRRARTAQHILAHLDRYLSSCQLGITLSSLILGALGEPVVSRLLIAFARAIGLEIPAEGHWIPVVSIGLAFTLITALHMTLGEQAPKMWALRRSEETALQTALFLRGFTTLLLPFIHAINGLSNWMLRMAGMPPQPGLEPTHTAEEIRSILSLSARSGHITEREYELTENVFRMIELEVRHIMVPRVDVEFLSLERPLQESLTVLRESGHSRFPLCERGLDTIVGFVHGKDVLEQVLRGETPDLRTLAYDALFVPTTMSLSNFLLELQQRRSHLAAVVDEHGTVIGLAFREDALEEIVGPLGDEFDESERDFQELPGGVYELGGRISLPEVCDRLDFELGEDEDEDQGTIGGHVTARLGRLPRKGDRVAVGPYQATVLEVARRRIQRLRLEKKPGEDAGA